MKDYVFTCEMEVRDYECDVQGVVNNARYIHYFEATRHKWLKSEGFASTVWHDQGFDMMVSEINIKYRSPLRGMEEFLSCINIRREGPRYIFEQDIYRKSDMRLCVSGEVCCVCIANGRLSRGDELMADFGKYLKEIK